MPTNDVDASNFRGHAFFSFLCDFSGAVVNDFANRISDRSVPAHALVGNVSPEEWSRFILSISRSSVSTSSLNLLRSDSCASMIGGLVSGGVLIIGQLLPIAEGSRGGEEVNRQAQIRQILHDLKNPISSIVTSCDYLVTYATDSLDPEQAEMIARMETSARAILRLTDRVSELTLHADA